MSRPQPEASHGRVVVQRNVLVRMIGNEIRDLRGNYETVDADEMADKLVGILAAAKAAGKSERG